MVKNKLLELIKDREKSYVQNTERVIEMILPSLKEGLEKAFYNSENVDLYILDVGIVPQNFRFLRIDGKIITVDIGDKIDVGEGQVEVDIENIWDFARQFSLIIPALLLDEKNSDQIADYLIKVKDNNDKIPESVMKEHKIDREYENVREFEKVDKKLDKTQLIALKYFKSSSIH